MTAPHDTPEAVEVMARIVGLEIPTPDGDTIQPKTTELVKAAAMLRRLHARAVDAERERDQAENVGAVLVIRAERAEAALAIARADALREAAKTVQAIVNQHRGVGEAQTTVCSNAILALIPQEKPNDR